MALPGQNLPLQVLRLRIRERAALAEQPLELGKGDGSSNRPLIFIGRPEVADARVNDLYAVAVKLL